MFWEINLLHVHFDVHFSERWDNHRASVFVIPQVLLRLLQFEQAPRTKVQTVPKRFGLGQFIQSNFPFVIAIFPWEMNISICFSHRPSEIICPIKDHIQLRPFSQGFSFVCDIEWEIPDTPIFLTTGPLTDSRSLPTKDFPLLSSPQYIHHRETNCIVEMGTLNNPWKVNPEFFLFFKVFLNDGFEPTDFMPLFLCMVTVDGLWLVTFVQPHWFLFHRWILIVRTSVLLINIAMYLKSNIIWFLFWSNPG